MMNFQELNGHVFKRIEPNQVNNKYSAEHQKYHSSSYLNLSMEIKTELHQWEFIFDFLTDDIPNVRSI